MKFTGILIIFIFIRGKLEAELLGKNEEGKTVREIFQSFAKKECVVDGLRCTGETAETKSRTTFERPFGPKFQKVHLELPRINPVRTGYVRRINLIEGKSHEMKTLAIHPPIFEIKNFLSVDECDAMIHLAKEKGMDPVVAVEKNLGIPSENMHTVFDTWDKNLDGTLSFDEISEINEIKHLLLTEDDIQEMYEKLGMRPENGGLSYGELERVTFAKFKEYMENLSRMKTEMAVNQTEQTWLWHDEDELLVYDDVFQNYHQRLSNLTRIPKQIIEESEPIQVTLSRNGSFTECRHDSDALNPDMPCCAYGSTSSCRMCRFISVMYFLNDVDDGELLFPLADNKTFLWDDLHKNTLKACSKAPNASLSNLVIKPQKGMAIMWYNHYIGRNTGWTSSLDPLSFYGSNYLSKGEKWVATTWLNILGDGVNELKPWRMGTNWLSQNNKKQEIIELMRNDDFIEGEPYLHDPKLTALDENEAVEESYTESSPASTEQEMARDYGDKNVSPPRDSEKNASMKKTNEEKNTEQLDYWKGHTILNEEKKSKKSEEKIALAESRNAEADMSLHEKLERKKTEKINEESESNIHVGENIAERHSDNGRDEKKAQSHKRPRSPEKGEGPLGPPLRNIHMKKGEHHVSPKAKEPIPYVLASGKIIENKIVVSVLMLIEELSRDELEVIARTLHERLQLACIPIMINPIGPM